MKRVLKNICRCEQLYNLTEDSLSQQLLLKLALLETAGWLENIFDELYLFCAQDQDSRKKIDEYIEHIYSCDWKHFHNCLSFGLGINTVSKLERDSKPQDIQKMKALLGDIKSHRDSLAHNYVCITKDYISFKVLKEYIYFFDQSIRYIKEYIGNISA